MTTLTRYRPLIVLTALTFLAGLAISMPSGFAMTEFMHGFMGTFLLFFAALKLFDISGFKKGFVQYDLLAKRLPFYAFVYPFLELGLALGYLSFACPLYVYGFTIGLFGFGTLGVAWALRQGLNIDCPCMGTVLKVPLSTVTLSEDIIMVVMGLALFFA